MSVEQRNRDAATSVMNAISTRDLDALFRMYSPRARFWQCGQSLSSAGWHTIEGAGQTAAKVFALIDGPLNLEILSMTAEGDRVAVEAVGRARLVDGRPYENQYHFLMRFDADGKVIEFKEYLDTLYLFDTLFSGKRSLD
jgi:ketosteroid isomerase-like protein